MLFYEEGHWFQHFTALLLVLGALFFSFRNNTSSSLRIIGSFGLLWLGLDEFFMIHECVKMGPLRGFHSNSFRDTLTLVYYVIGLLGVFSFRKALMKSFKEVLIISVLTLLGGVVVSVDTFGLLPRSFDIEVEEISELLMAVLLLAYSMIGIKEYDLIDKSYIVKNIFVLFLFGGGLLLIVYYGRSLICTDFLK